MRALERWLVVVALVIGAPGRGDAAVLINEVLADPPAGIGDANGDGVASSVDDEFVELVNTEASAVSLGLWTLADATKVRHVFSAESVIPGYGFFVVFGGGDPSGVGPHDIASTGGLSLNNTADTVTLSDAFGIVMDALTYGAEAGQDVSITRAPDATGPWTRHGEVSGLRYTPGTSLDGARQWYTPGPSGGDAHGSPIVPEPSLFGLGLVGWLSAARRHTMRRRA